MKTFFENYDYTLFGNGLNTTAFLKQDNMAHSYNDMPAFVHLFNDIGLIPSIVIFLAYLFFMIFLYKKRDNDSLKMMLVIAALCLISSNPVAPANAGFFI